MTTRHPLVNRTTDFPKNLFFGKLSQAGRPNAYSYASDDQRSTYHCHLDSLEHVGPDFEVYFGYSPPTRTAWPSVSTEGKATGKISLHMSRGGVLRYTANVRESKDARLEVFSSSGRRLRRIALAGNSGSIALAGLSQGAYVVSLRAGRILKTERLVIAH